MSYANDRRFVESTLEAGEPLVPDSRDELVLDSRDEFVLDGDPPDRREFELVRPLDWGTTACVYLDEFDPFRRVRPVPTSPTRSDGRDILAGVTVGRRLDDPPWDPEGRALS